MDGFNLAALVGRVFLATIFLSSAFGKITNFGGTVQYMELHGVPMANALCVVAILMEALGGLSLIFGFYTRWGAVSLAVFLVPTTLIFHLGPDQRIQLLKNLAIMGGLLEVAAFGPGSVSLDHAGE